MKIPKLDRARIAISAGILVLLVVVVGLGLAFAQQLRLSQKLGEEVERLEQAVATQEAWSVHLTATLEYVQSDAYVEQWARDEAKMVKPGEVVMIPLIGARQAESPAPPADSEAESPETPEDRPFWKVWLGAIFGP